MRSHVWQRVLRRFKDTPNAPDSASEASTDDKSSDVTPTTPGSSISSPPTPERPDPDITARQLRKFFIDHQRRVGKLPLSEVELVEKYVRTLPGVPIERLIPATTSKRAKAKDLKPYPQIWVTDQSSFRDDLTSIVRHIRAKQARTSDPQCRHSEPASTAPHASLQVLYDDLPLDYGSKEIRLLRIRPGQGAEPLQCQLFKVELGSKPSFDALSYAWSCEKHDASIHVDDHDVKISEVLHQALLQLRQPSENAIIWVDAVCMNQNSIDEKNHQVPMMRDIYSLASSVVIWLGNPVANLDLANECIEELKNFEDDDSHSIRTLDHYLSESIQSAKSFEAGLIELFGNRWFSRTWVLQEAALASKEPIFFCGQHRISWTSLNLLHSALSSYYAPRPENSYHIHRGALHNAFCASSFNKIYLLRQEVQKQDSCGLKIEEALFISKDQHASDPRDHIYGILGLVSPDDSVQIEVDYSKPAEEVYRDVTRSILVGRNNLSFLAAKTNQEPNCNIYSNFSPSNGSGASWIRNFQAHDHSDSNHSHIPDQFHPVDPKWTRGDGTGSRSPADLGISPDLKFDGFSLFARGISLDVVQNTTIWDEPVIASGQGPDEFVYASPVPVLEFLWKNARVTSHQDNLSQDHDSGGSCARPETYIYRLLSYLDKIKSQTHAHNDQHNGTPDIKHQECPSQAQNSINDFRSAIHGLCLPDEMKKLALEHHESDTYQPLNTTPIDFWEAVSRTLISNEITGERSAESNLGDEALLWILYEMAKPVVQRETSQAAKRGHSPARDSLYQDERVIHALEGVWNDFEHLTEAARVTIAHSMGGRRIFTTRNRWMGVGPCAVHSGDVVVMLFGGHVPYLLRPVDDHYIFIGECYVDGIMHGELVREWTREVANATIEGKDTSVQAYGYASPKQFEIR